jgi:predicted nucleic acid-binding protein
MTRYEGREDKEYSLTDCISMNVMDSHRLTEALTNDHHFEQEGFTVLIQKSDT